ncbi:FMN-binding split barrel-related protein [Cordyceps fumosorosea ARSEF 2679]|uniref:FMN-binding split barrel-related protein n=1 Tax=Cordyceps fumosorosea (strain ARSEF 2679) TaxID=1081104 RepID=A0A167NLA8_CORFA|nr:FMN-binding split barrel-related protein [Cordyceps fumosorosea ARSEF 2679]OAA55682.1 FMN-binding split barrel-related protein [Cordyceps fumosorosea ARSEF 2679]
MKLSSTLAIFGTAAAALAADQQAMDNAAPAGHRIPTSQESAVMGRRILALGKIADMVTVFPTKSKSAASRRAASANNGVEGQPVGMADYVADCESKGEPTILEIKIGTTFRNVAAGSNLTISMRWEPPYPPAKRIGVVKRSMSTFLSWFGRRGEQPTPNPVDASIPDTTPYSADNLPRFSLFGYLEPLEGDAATMEHIKDCYVKKHPDAKLWLPGNNIHSSEWARMVVTKVYWVGGFGDRAYIGWIPVEEWNAVTEAEWRAIKLPGETKDWSEWNAYDNQEL